MLKKALLLIFAFLTLVFFTVSLSPFVRQLMLSTGIIQEEVLIAGTGSMYPTFPKGKGESDVIKAQEIVAWPQMRRFPGGITLLGTNLFSHQLRYGDIVEFENEKTDEISKGKYHDIAGFVKRVIAVAGDTVELSDGFVFINGKILDEPYTAKSRSTYGGEYLPDCKSLTVPPGYVFVMGDNRKASLDSRHELELVAVSDVNYVLAWENQGEYKYLWRDTKEDLSSAHSATLNPVQFVKLLNDKRKEKKLRPYLYNTLLSSSGKKRGQTMINFGDFSTEATKSGITLTKAIKQSGYQNIIFAEVFTRGFYEAEELLENFLEFPETQKILYSSEYQDIGVAAVLGEINNCPVQVVVAHLGGYVSPNYSKEEADSWLKLINNLEEVLPSWRSLKNAEGIDQNKINQLLLLLEQRFANAKRIYNRMSANQWLTNEERELAEDDKRLSEEANKAIAEFKKHE